MFRQVSSSFFSVVKKNSFQRRKTVLLIGRSISNNVGVVNESRFGRVKEYFVRGALFAAGLSIYNVVESYQRSKEQHEKFTKYVDGLIFCGMKTCLKFNETLDSQKELVKSDRDKVAENNNSFDKLLEEIYETIPNKPNIKPSANKLHDFVLREVRKLRETNQDKIVKHDPKLFYLLSFFDAYYTMQNLRVFIDRKEILCRVPEKVRIQYLCYLLSLVDSSSGVFDPIIFSEVLSLPDSGFRALKVLLVQQTIQTLMINFYTQESWLSWLSKLPKEENWLDLLADAVIRVFLFGWQPGAFYDLFLDTLPSNNKSSQIKITAAVEGSSDSKIQKFKLSLQYYHHAMNKSVDELIFHMVPMKRYIVQESVPKFRDEIRAVVLGYIASKGDFPTWLFYYMKYNTEFFFTNKN